MYRLSTGEFLHEFDDVGWSLEMLQSGQNGQLYGYRSLSVSRMNPTTAESIVLMTTSEDWPEQELIKGLSADGQSVLLAA